MPDLNWTFLISFAAIIISLVSVTINIVDHLKYRLNIGLKTRTTLGYRDCLFIPPLYTPGGNDNSLILSVEIINKSAQQITISDVYIRVGKRYMPCAKADHTESGYSAHDSEGAHRLDIEHELITCPFVLLPYDVKSGFLIFDIAGSTKGDYCDVKVRIITPRGNRSFVIKNVVTREGYAKELI